MAEPATAAPSDSRPNRYRVDVRREELGHEPRWTVSILDPSGRDVSSRACADEAEARTYASTVRQHIHWLSEHAFRSSYRLPDETRR